MIELGVLCVFRFLWKWQPCCHRAFTRELEPKISLRNWPVALFRYPILPNSSFLLQIFGKKFIFLQNTYISSSSMGDIYKCKQFFGLCATHSFTNFNFDTGSKVSFFHHCSKMQIIPLQKLIIQTCFFQFLWFFRLKCWFKGQIIS